METEIGDRLRLQEYRQRFSTAELATTLSEELAESQPAVHVSGSLLQEWYRKYHPDSGSLAYAHAADLDEAMGAELRQHYSGVGYKNLRNALRQRPKPVIIGERCARTWVETYASVAASSSSGVQRTTADRGAASSSTMKRPAAVASGSQSSSSNAGMKRPAAAPPASTSSKKRCIEPRQTLESSTQIEECCGERYRAEVVKFGLGMTRAIMQIRLHGWGYDVKPNVCQLWLSQYKTKSLRQATSTMLTTNLKSLQTWYHVDGLRGLELQQRLATETGLYYNASNLITWLKAPAQQLPHFDHNEEIHGSYGW